MSHLSAYQLVFARTQHKKLRNLVFKQHKKDRDHSQYYVVNSWAISGTPSLQSTVIICFTPFPKIHFEKNVYFFMS